VTVRYVDAQFASQQQNKIWSAGTHSAEMIPTQLAYAALASALADCQTGDVVRLASGTYALPGGWDALIVSLEGCGASTIVSGNVILPMTHVVRMDRLCFTGNWLVEGRLGATKVVATGLATASGPHSGVVLADFEGQSPARGGGGAVAFYPAARFPSGGPGGRRPSDYRLTGVIKAPAKSQRTGGSEEPRWIWIGDRKFRREEVSGREGDQVSVAYADTTSVLYCRGGFPFHPDMTVTIHGFTYEIRGLAQTPTPENETKLFVADRRRGV
jgi:hypothetical protein